jgi:hypothetical protein
VSVESTLSPERVVVGDRHDPAEAPQHDQNSSGDSRGYDAKAHGLWTYRVTGAVIVRSKFVTHAVQRGSKFGRRLVSKRGIR